MLSPTGPEAQSDGFIRLDYVASHLRFSLLTFTQLSRNCQFINNGTRCSSRLTTILRGKDGGIFGYRVPVMLVSNEVEHVEGLDKGVSVKFAKAVR